MNELEFYKELNEWYDNETVPKSASKDVSYLLKLQKERFEKHNVNNQCVYTSTKNEEDVHSKIMNKSCINSTIYNSFMTFCCLTRQSILTRNNKKIYSKKKEEILYTTTTDLKQGKVYENETYCCPNCGAISTISKLQNGCEFCGTKFLLSELYPKITDYMTLDNSTSRGKMKRGIILSMLVAGISLFICFMLKADKLNTPTIIEAIVTGLIGGAVMGYMCFGIIMFFYVLFRAIFSIIPCITTYSSKNQIIRKMRRIDKDFTYDYFINKVITMLKIIVFSENRDNVPQYIGQSSLAELDNILDMNYKAEIGLTSIKIENNYCKMKLAIPFDIIVDTETDIIEKRKVFKIELLKNMNEKENAGFSIMKVQCKGCGMSFDAYRERFCPGCHKKYELKDDDWVITDLH